MSIGSNPALPERSPHAITPTAIGDKLAIILERSAIDELGIQLGTKLEMSVEEGEIRIRLADEDRRALVLGSARKMMARHEEAFRKLAQ